MRARTALALLAITAAGFTAAGVYGNTYATPAPVPTSTVHGCTDATQNNTDEPCFTYERDRLTNTFTVVTLQPGQTLD